MVGGGIGTAPLLLLCKELCRAGVRPDLFVGFRDTTYGMDRFVPWCRDIYAATAFFLGFVKKLIGLRVYILIFCLYAKRQPPMLQVRLSIEGSAPEKQLPESLTLSASKCTPR